MTFTKSALTTLLTIVLASTTHAAMRPAGPQQPTIPTQALPCDLTITSIGVNGPAPKVGENANIKVVVKNVGGGASPATKVKVSCETDYAGTFKSADKDVPALNPGQSAEIVYSYPVTHTGHHHGGASVDPYKTVTEKDENNNTLFTLAFDVTQTAATNPAQNGSAQVGSANPGLQMSKPDLVVTQVALVGGKTIVKPHEPFQVTFKIKNNGPGNAGPSKAMLYFSGPYPIEVMVDVPALAKNAEFSGKQDFTLLTLAEAGQSPEAYDMTAIIKVIADQSNKVDETNEQNNDASVQFKYHPIADPAPSSPGSKLSLSDSQVQANPGLQMSKPDLVVTQVSIGGKTVVKPHEPFQLTYKIKNNGPGSAGPSKAMVYFSGPYPIEVMVDVPALAKNAEFSGKQDFTLLTLAEAGQSPEAYQMTAIIKVIADQNNKIDETNEQNNDASIQFKYQP